MPYPFESWPDRGATFVSVTSEWVVDKVIVSDTARSGPKILERGGQDRFGKTGRTSPSRWLIVGEDYAIDDYLEVEVRIYYDRMGDGQTQQGCDADV